MKNFLNNFSCGLKKTKNNRIKRKKKQTINHKIILNTKFYISSSELFYYAMEDLYVGDGGTN